MIQLFPQFLKARDFISFCFVFEGHVSPPVSDPAFLLKAWPSASVKCLRACGGFEVDMAWKHGKLTEARIHSQLDVVEKAIAKLHNYIDKKATEMKAMQRLLGELSEFNHRQVALLRHAPEHPNAAFTARREDLANKVGLRLVVAFS